MNCACGRPSPDAFLCVGCTLELERLLSEMPFWLQELEVTVSRQAKMGGGGARAKGDEEPLPYNPTASNLAWEAGNTLTSWARHLMESRGVTLSAGKSAEDASRFLLRHIDSIRQDEAAAVMLDEIRDVQQRIERTVDRNEVRWWAGPCFAPVVTMEATGNCQSQLYSRTADLFTGTGTIKCDGWRQDEPGCSAVHDPAARGAWLLASLDGALLPLSLLMAAVPTLAGVEAPARDTVRMWRNRGRLEAHGVDRYGVELFQGGQFVTLVLGSVRRKVA